MYDSTQVNMGRLEVYRSVTDRESTIFTRSGNQGFSWQQASVDTTISFGERVGNSLKTTPTCRAQTIIMRLFVANQVH